MVCRVESGLDQSIHVIRRSSTVIGMTPGDVDDPLYARIAASIRGQIQDGTLAEGSRLPSEVSLAETWGVARLTIRQALEVLRVEGLISTSPRSGRFVRRKPALSIRSSDRYRRRVEGEETSPFARDAAREQVERDWVWETTRLRADDVVAQRLGIEPGAYVMRTTYVFRAGGAPIQASTSWEPHELVGGTAIEEPEGEGRITGVIARMDSIGVRVNRVVELVRARPATAVERSALDIPDDVWVQVIERTHWAGDRAVETADIVIPADRYLLEYDIPIT